MRTLAAGVIAASLACAPAAAAEPVSGVSSVPLSQCKVTAIHNPDHSGEPPTSFTTVYVDVSCPNEHDDWGWVGIGAGF